MSVPAILIPNSYLGKGTYFSRDAWASPALRHLSHSGSNKLSKIPRASMAFCQAADSDHVTWPKGLQSLVQLANERQKRIQAIASRHEYNDGQV